MNRKMIGGIVRHALTVFSSSVVALDSMKDGLLSKLIGRFESGGWMAKVSIAAIIFAVVWSIWAKAEENTKRKMISAMTLGVVKNENKRNTETGL